MKKFYTILLACLVQSLSILADDIYIKDFSIKQGETKTVEVILENTTAIQGDQPVGFVIEALPAGLSFAGTNANAKFTSRLEAAAATSLKVNSKGVLKVSAVSATVKAGTGTIATFDVTASETFSGCNINVINKNVNGDETLAPTTTKVSLEEDAPARTEPMYINDFTIERGKTKTVEIILNLPEGIDGTQPVGCAITTMPAGLSFNGTNANGAFTSRLVSAAATSIKLNSKGVLKISAVSAVVTGGTDAWATFEVKASDDFEGGNMIISAINVAGDETIPDVTVKVTGAPASSIDAISTVESNDAVVYDLAGRRVNANAKGLLIKGGKKYVVK